MTTTNIVPIDFNPRDPAFMADPFPLYARMREAAPAYWSERLTGWVLTTHAGVRAALNEPRFSADRISPFMRGISPERRDALKPLTDGLLRWAVFTDPPDHRRLRSLMNKAFTPQIAERMRPRVTELVRGFIDRLRGRDSFDFIAEFAYPLPVTVISEMVGVSQRDLDQFRHWSDELALFVGNALGVPDKHERANQSIIAMHDYIRGIVNERRRNPQEDIMSGLIAAEEAGEKLTEDEIIATCGLLVFAGHETTTHLLSGGMRIFANESEAWERLRSDPAIAPTAVEEVLRFDGPTGAIVRTAREAAQIEGTAIEPGQRIFAMINAANRDPRVFDRPEEFRLDRADNPHLAFGFGAHYCIGAPLARIEAQIAFTELAREIESFKVAEGGLHWRDALVIRGPERMEIEVKWRG